MTDYLTLGPTPCDESCIQIDDPNYLKWYRVECSAYRNQLMRQLRQHFSIPDSQLPACSLRIKAFPHDFGTYHEVCAFYSDDNQESVGQAFYLEATLPDNWDEEALKELKEQEYPLCNS